MKVSPRLSSKGKINRNRTMRKISVLLLIFTILGANVRADGPASKLINYNGLIGQNSSYHGVAVDFFINNVNPVLNQYCHDLTAGNSCIYNSYGVGMRVYNNHSHSITLKIKNSLIFSQFPPTACEAQISWVDERGSQKKYRNELGGFTIEPGEYLGIGGIASQLGSSPQCFYPDRNWEAKAYNVNLYWKEIIPPPPKQPPAQQPPTSQPTVQQPPVQQPPPSQPSPVPDPAAMQKPTDEDRFAQRVEEISTRMLESDFGDAAMCRFHTDSLAAHRDMANQFEDATLAEVMRPLIASLEQTQVAACDRSKWSDASLQSDSPAGSKDCFRNVMGSEVCVDTPVTVNPDDYGGKAAPQSSGSTKIKPPKAELRKPCPRGVVNCNLPRDLERHQQL
jgi:hypothetical protein